MVNKEISRVLVIVLTAIGLFAIALMGSGMTGKIIYDHYTIKDICSNNNECQANEVCCLFYQDDSGVCHTQDMCKTITEITKSERITKDTIQNLVIERPKNSINSNMMLIGSGMLFFIVIFLFFLSRSAVKDEKNYEKELVKKLSKIESKDKKKTGKKIVKKR